MSEAHGGSYSVSSRSKYTFKTIILGDAAVGKTSIVAKHVSSSFKENYIPSIGANVTSRDYDIDGTYVTLMIWDIAAQEAFSRVRFDYYQGAKGAMLVYDVSRPQTYEDVISWYDDLEKGVPKGIPLMVVGNKVDLPPIVQSQSGKRLAGDLGADFIETSAKTGENIGEAFERLVRKLYASVSATQAKGKKTKK
jgi:small GTP-binding protein